MLDVDSAEWLTRLSGGGRVRDAAIVELHGLLLRTARVELARRASRSGISGKEVDDLAHQAAADAVLAVLRRLDTFRGESRFTTWAYKFAILEVSNKLGRHFWRRPAVSLDAKQWERIPERFGVTPERAVEAGELFDAVRATVDARLTTRQREIFNAVVVDGITLDTLAVRMHTDRNSIYKAMFDARRKIRAALITNSYLDEPASARV
jgi:RNA polymerase sigma-70 factor (ECF subfamily)